MRGERPRDSRRSGRAAVAAGCLVALLCLGVPAVSHGAPAAPPGAAAGSRVARGVVGEGACAISGMSAEQCQLLALQKARAAAIERAAGVKVASATLVRDGAVAVDLIRTYARGYVIAERVEWLPLAQYQDSPSRPPIPEYRVRIVADVAVPERLDGALGLGARLNTRVFRAGEKARIEIAAAKEARIALFNITADDKVVMVFPHPFESANVVAPGKPVVYPGDGSRIELVMHTLPGHARDAEAFFVVAVPGDREVDFAATFGCGKPYPLTAFFERYAEIAPHSDEVILPYTVEVNE